MPKRKPLSSLLDDEQQNFFKVDYTHNLHKKCLQGWFDQKRSECPVCQNIILPHLWDQPHKYDMNKAGYRRVISIGAGSGSAGLSEFDNSKRTLDV